MYPREKFPHQNGFWLYEPEHPDQEIISIYTNAENITKPEVGCIQAQQVPYYENSKRPRIDSLRERNTPDRFPDTEIW